VLRSLTDSIRDARQRANQVRAALDQLDRFIDEVVARRGQSLVELSQHYLPELSYGTITTQFAEVRVDLERLLRKKQAHEQQLQEAWDESLDRRSQLETELDQVTNRLDDWAAQRDQLEEQLAERLLANEKFQSLSAEAITAERELGRNEERIAEIREEVAEKLPAYEKSRLFQYLHRRGFGTAKYETRGLARTLDRWVAKLVNYNENRQSYNFLRVTPELIAAEVERRRAEFMALMEQVEAIEDDLSDEMGLTEVLRQGNETGVAREELLGKLRQLETEQGEIETELQQLEASQNEYYVTGVNRLKGFLGSMEESALEARTRTTPQSADDAIFREIKSLNEQLRDAKNRSHEDRQQWDRWQEKLSGLDRVVRQFRSHEFDSRRSVFSQRLDIQAEVDRFLEGDNRADRLWSTLRRHQQFLRYRDNDGFGRRGDVFGNDVSRVLGRVLLEVAGVAMRQAVTRGMNRRGPFRQQHRQSSGRPSYGRQGGFTSGRGF